MTPLLVALGLMLSGGGGNDDHNEHRDCENNTGECSDDDQVVIAPVICVEPGSCRFGD